MTKAILSKRDPNLPCRICRNPRHMHLKRETDCHGFELPRRQTPLCAHCGHEEAIHREKACIGVHLTVGGHNRKCLCEGMSR